MNVDIKIALDLAERYRESVVKGRAYLSKLLIGSEIRPCETALVVSQVCFEFRNHHALLREFIDDIAVLADFEECPQNFNTLGPEGPSQCKT